MPESILVISASANGSTPDTGRALGNELRRAGYPVEIMELKDVDSLEGCTAIILGIPLYTVFSGNNGLGMFRQRFGEELANIPVAVFGAGLFYEGLKPEKEEYVKTALKKILSPIQPVAITLFVSTLGRENLHTTDPDESPGIHPVADYPEPDKIRDWAATLPLLLGLRQADSPLCDASTHTVGI